MPPMLAGIDCGTTATKAAIVASDGSVRGTGRVSTPCVERADGRVEHDPDGLVEAALGALRQAVAASGAAPGEVAALALSCQRATFLCLGPDETPRGAAISWQDARGAEEVAAFAGRYGRERFQQVTGLPLNPVFTIGKLLWLRRHEPERLARGDRLALVHDFLLRRLGCDGFVLDEANASLTGLFDVHERRWCEDLLAALDLSPAQLPALTPSGSVVGALSREAAARCGLLPGTPLVAGGGDQQCAGVGAGAVRPGVVEITLGTAGVPLCAVERPVIAPASGLMCCAHAAPGAWELEGFQNSAGASLGWIQRVLAADARTPEAADALLARVPPGARGLLFYPYLAGGSSAPHWNPDARGMLLGLTLAHDAAAVLRAVVEGVCLETGGILDAFAALDLAPRELRVTGGCSRIAGWNRILADVAGTPVVTLATPDASLVGAAVLAAVGARVHASVPEGAHAMVRTGPAFLPDPARVGVYAALRRRFTAIHETLDRGGVFQRLAAAGSASGA